MSNVKLTSSLMRKWYVSMHMHGRKPSSLVNCLSCFCKTAAQSCNTAAKSFWMQFFEWLTTNLNAVLQLGEFLTSKIDITKIGKQYILVYCFFLYCPTWQPIVLGAWVVKIIIDYSLEALLTNIITRLIILYK